MSLARLPNLLSALFIFAIRIVCVKDQSQNSNSEAGPGIEPGSPPAGDNSRWRYLPVADCFTWCPYLWLDVHRGPPVHPTKPWPHANARINLLTSLSTFLLCFHSQEDPAQQANAKNVPLTTTPATNPIEKSAIVYLPD